jgi:hypothetical protein
MKAVLIGSDLILDENGDPKIMEVNTNTGVYSVMLSELDFSGLLNLISENSITEVHYIGSPDETVPEPDLNTGHPDQPGYNEMFLWGKLKSIIEPLGAVFTYHRVAANSLTVPYIEDGPSILILRQAYDATALIDETYCSDKMGLQDLVKGETYSIPTYLNSGSVLIDNITEMKSASPNIILKSRYPNYDAKEYPRLYKIDDISEFPDVKSSVAEGYYMQEFINSEHNLYEGKYGTIRSIDILYGDNLDVIHLGSYVNTATIENDVWANTLVDGEKYLDNKSRVKWISKVVTDILDTDYHADNNSSLWASDGTLINVDDVKIGDVLKSASFSNFPVSEGNSFLPDVNSTFDELSSTLVVNSASVVNTNYTEIDAVFIKITMEDGTGWIDYPTSYTYVEDKDTLITHFKRVNLFEIGDSVIIINHTTQLPIKKAITNLELVFQENKKIYQINVEEQDIFLPVMDEDNNLSLIQHNVGCCDFCSPYFSPNNCGAYCCQYSCDGCNSNCFIGDAMIDTPDGQVAIKDIKIGDSVISFDFSSGEKVIKSVGGLYQIEYSEKILIINGHNTKATVGHPLAVKELNGNIGWAAYDPMMDAEYHKDLKVNKLEEGKYSININGEWELIESIDLYDFSGNVYNISVDGDCNNYYAEKVLVHNIFDKKV